MNSQNAARAVIAAGAIIFGVTPAPAATGAIPYR
jgi:hypothetical protein